MVRAPRQAEAIFTPVPCGLCGEDCPRRLLVDRVWIQGRSHDFPVLRCGACGFVYVSPRGTGQVFHNRCGGAARRDAAVVNRPIYRRGMAALRRHGLSRGARVLDLGCARGDFLEFASQAGCSVAGLDINPGLASEARARGFEVHTGDLRSLALCGYDAVTLWDVIEHVDDPVGVLRACRDALVPGGLLFFHTGNARFQIPKARALYALNPGGGPHLIPYQHVSHFDPVSSRDALRRAGLEPLAVDRAGTLHYPQRSKRWAMQAINALAGLPARIGGPILTSSIGAIGRRPDRA